MYANTVHLQSSAVSPWLLKLGIRRELGLYADTVAKRGAHYFFYAWELPVGMPTNLHCPATLLGSAALSSLVQPTLQKATAKTCMHRDVAV